MFFTRTLRSEEEVREAEAELNLRALTAFSSFKGQSDFGTWLYAVCRNVLREKYRKDKRARDLIDKLGRVHEPAPFELSPEELLLADSSRKCKAVVEALGEISAKQRRLVMLVLFSGFSVREAGEKMELSHDAARGLCSRAVKALRKVLKKRGEIDV